ncbi:hypothetical protein TNIN_399831 [Trichonephila inaurata madagascariensis]|uniref:Uncharacterized protein n=1 Tax=Trichonephila inaurata madagascariensis TaxID=2747483 RepID=A0A8X6XHA9_9ARAC|nr:hypothetical protein TNIN_399831 [Trichonephila inaurata madagascariensis]
MGQCPPTCFRDQYVTGIIPFLFKTHTWKSQDSFGIDESLEDQEGHERPSAIDDNTLRGNIEAKACKTIQEVIEQLKIHHSTVILHQMKELKKLEKRRPSS